MACRFYSEQSLGGIGLNDGKEYVMQGRSDCVPQPSQIIQVRNNQHHPGLPLKKLLCRQVALGALFAVGMLSASIANGQSTFGSVRGTVQDATGASIPGALVTVHSIDENVDRTAKTDGSGEFAVENLKAGHYSVIVHDEGFTDSTVASVALEARQQLRIPVTLSVQSGATTVQVMASPDQINTENATLSDSKDNQQITQLPLNNRATTTSPLGALALSPNVQQDSSGNIALGGASSSMVNFSVDGISTANVRQN
jgi:hypothetical protein